MGDQTLTRPAMARHVPAEPTLDFSENKAKIPRGVNRAGTGQRGTVIRFNKPVGVLPQFSDRGTASPRPTLSAFIGPEHILRDVWIVTARGLMALTDDGQLQAVIADPRHKLPKTYLVQVEGVPDDDALGRLRRGSRVEGRADAARAGSADR